MIVPTTGEVYFNPLNMAVDVGGQVMTQQVISVPSAIENKSEVPLSVSVTVTGQIWEGSDMRLASYDIKDEELTVKCAFVYFEMKSASGETPSAWDSEFDADKHIVLRNGASRTMRDMVIIDKADRSNHFGAFRLAGFCGPIAPRTPWTEKDGINVSIAFSFKPLSVDTVVP